MASNVRRQKWSLKYGLLGLIISHLELEGSLTKWRSSALGFFLGPGSFWMDLQSQTTGISRSKGLFLLGGWGSQDDRKSFFYHGSNHRLPLFRIGWVVCPYSGRKRFFEPVPGNGRLKLGSDAVVGYLVGMIRKWVLFCCLKWPCPWIEKSRKSSQLLIV